MCQKQWRGYCGCIRVGFPSDFLVHADRKSIENPTLLLHKPLMRNPKNGSEMFTIFSDSDFYWICSIAMAKQTQQKTLRLERKVGNTTII